MQPLSYLYVFILFIVKILIFRVIGDYESEEERLLHLWKEVDANEEDIIASESEYKVYNSASDADESGW